MFSSENESLNHFINGSSAHSMCRLCLKAFREFEEQIIITRSIQSKISDIFPPEVISLQNNLSYVCLQCSINVENFSEFRSNIISRQFELIKHFQRLNPKAPEPAEKDVFAVSIKVEVVESEIVKTENFYDSNDDESQNVDYESELTYDQEYQPEGQTDSDDKLTRERRRKKVCKETQPQELAPCESCGKFMTRDYVKRHMEEVHMKEEDKSVCDLCGKRFSHRRPLIRHMISHVPREFRLRTLQCNLCPKRFCTRDGLKSHEKTHIKTPTQPVTCHCGKIFTSKIGLYQHVRSTHRRQEYEVSCKECGKTFLSKPSLAEHFRIHHTPGQKNKFQCNICGKLYNRMQDVKVHQKHHREKTFICEVPECNKKFILPSELNQHIKISHMNQKDYKCTYEGCAAAFARRPHLKRHALLIHEGFRRKCPVEECTFFTGRRDFMRTHLKQHANLGREELEAIEATIKEMGLC